MYARDIVVCVYVCVCVNLLRCSRAEAAEIRGMAVCARNIKQNVDVCVCVVCVCVCVCVHSVCLLQLW
jgi:hypothetical protein